MIRRVLFIYTGGTLGMVRDEHSGALISFALDDVIHKLPELKALGYQLDAITPFHPIDSSQVEPHHWQSIAQSIAEHYSSYDGFVVLHGTDTMAYTAGALSYMLDGLAKPVILTGSQLPLGYPRTDARENLTTAIELAGPSMRMVIPGYQRFAFTSIIDCFVAIAPLSSIPTNSRPFNRPIIPLWPRWVLPFAFRIAIFDRPMNLQPNRCSNCVKELILALQAFACSLVCQNRWWFRYWNLQRIGYC